MKINEFTKPNKQELLESLNQDKSHTFSPETLEEISESIAKTDDSSPKMTTEEALKLLRSGGY